MTQIVPSKNCCGIREISGLYNYEGARGVIAEVYNYFFRRGNDCAIIMFSDRTGDCGNRLATYIKRHKLGELVCTKSVNNPNSGHNIKAWLWTVDKKALKALVKNK